ncbi:DUF4417 domain-containing protein [Selenomonas sp. KH1T6]|uniref:DUF4417 domain-containing protein n=1 Tax=Selenomonas sp. KH1T6 TaxID=3158784 RepID=UPI0008A79AA2|nr:protein of unknown function [Selenomonas ruminantium]
MKKSKFDDGFQAYLTKDALLVGEPGIPMMMNLHNTELPLDIIPFDKAKKCKDKRKYVHFYMHDKEFSRVLTATNKYLALLKEFDGVISPDCSMAVGQARCLQQANTYMNRAVGFYLQQHGIPVIPNIRWSDEESFEYCFLGVPQNIIVAISTHGCLKTKEDYEIMRIGIGVMLDKLHPTAVVVHGYMPDSIFGEYLSKVEFRRYASQFERTHVKRVG